MHALSFTTEWLAADGVRSPELAATWCRLQISVDGRVVTRVEDPGSRSTRNAIYCAAYPLAEWAATHWWMLRSHVRPATLLDGWRDGQNSTAVGPLLAAHSTRAAGDGFLWPQLMIVPEGERTLLRWAADSHTRVNEARFVSEGRVWANAASVSEALGEFVGGVLERLHDEGVDGTLLHDEWEAILAADAEEAAFCNAAAALGLDPYDIDDAQAEAIVAVGASLGDGLAHELVAAADPARIHEDLSWVTTGLARLSRTPARRAAGPLASLQRLHLRSDRDGAPWEIGWRHGQMARDALSIAPDAAVPMNDLVAQSRLASADAALQGLGSGVGGHVQVIIGGASGAASTRFFAARALWRAANVDARPYLLTTAPTFEQRVERAFAAEFLAPAAGLRTMVDRGRKVVSTDDAERIGRHYKVSPVVIAHQLENQLGLVVAG